MDKVRVAFVKFAGLAAGGTERWLQLMAAHLPRAHFDVDYFYCDAAPYVGSNYKHADTDPSRLMYMQQQGVNLVKFSVGAKDVSKKTHPWVHTDFWEKFDATRYDLVQTGKAGPAEYPYCLMSVPVVECITLSAGVDRSPNIVWSYHLSEWQRRQWMAAGGNSRRSSVVPVPVLRPASANNLRQELRIPSHALVAGFHQRGDDGIFSPVPLRAFAKAFAPDRHFIVMGASYRYRKQAADLGLGNVHFLDHTGDPVRISEFLNSLNVFAHGRRDGETFGTVLAEAMMHGVACLSHAALVGDNNGHVETIGPGGLFAQNRDEYAAMLETLLSDDAMREKLSRKAKLHAQQYYSLERCIRQVQATYDQLSGVQPSVGTHGRPLPYGYLSGGYLQAGVADRAQPRTNVAVPAPNVEVFVLELVHQLLPHVKNFVDVGADTGQFCLPAAKMCAPGSVVLAYEDDPERLAALRQSVSLNNWEDRVISRPLLVGNLGSKPRKTETEEGAGWRDKIAEELVQCAVSMSAGILDQELQNSGLSSVEFIRINSPDRELDLLRSAEQTVCAYFPVLLLSGGRGLDGPPWARENRELALKWIGKHGYAVYECDEDLRLRRIRPGSNKSNATTNLCVERSLDEQWQNRLQVWALSHRVRAWFGRRLAGWYRGRAPTTRNTADRLWQAATSVRPAAQWPRGQFHDFSSTGPVSRHNDSHGPSDPG